MLNIPEKTQYVINNLQNNGFEGYDNGWIDEFCGTEAGAEKE